MSGDTVLFECGRQDCSNVARMVFDTDAGNARFRLPPGWACLPLPGTSPLKGAEFWMVCPKHCQRAMDELELQRQADSAMAIARAMQMVKINADDLTGR